MTYIKLLFCCTFMLFSINALAGKIPETTLSDNDIINNNYKTFHAGFENLDLDFINKIYTDDATYISEVLDQEIVIGKQNILDLYTVFFKKIAKKDAHIEVDFRVINRELTESSATDVGYYLVRFHPRKETGDPTSVFSGKFVLVSRKTAKDQWQFIVDSNTKTDPKYYFTAKPVSNLYYGRQFNQVPKPDIIVETESEPNTQQPIDSTDAHNH
ncbi:DUF4440 domain-containing protein [Shewanella sp. MMG014]|uniref:YybH family protein n=1 Tax=Shewanella sp. MMG014 TaxID=2822691 RepID=UPI001B368B45|nr:DUF4440 domain-containing protein [Shewanella sp. MMG014]MBQ4891660.1 DUF4440 domain-containing protein [Shewanella sp. MMG014]